jgi:hypothetical protein
MCWVELFQKKLEVDQTGMNQIDLLLMIMPLEKLFQLRIPSGPSTEGVGRQASSVRMVPLGERAPLAAASLDDFMKPYETFQFCKLVDLKAYEDPRHPDDDAAASEVPKNQARYVHFRLKTGKNPVSGFLETAFPEVSCWADLLADLVKERFLFPGLRLRKKHSSQIVTGLKRDAHKTWQVIVYVPGAKRNPFASWPLSVVEGFDFNEEWAELSEPSKKDWVEATKKWAAEQKSTNVVSSDLTSSNILSTKRAHVPSPSPSPSGPPAKKVKSGGKKARPKTKPIGTHSPPQQRHSDRNPDGAKQQQKLDKLTLRLEAAETELKELHRSSNTKQPPIHHDEEEEQKQKRARKERKRKHAYAIAKLDDFHGKLLEFLGNKEKLAAGLQSPDLFQKAITAMLLETKFAIAQDKD